MREALESPSRLTVIVADDDPHLRKLTIASLRIDRAFVIVERDSGEAVLETLDSSPPPDVVLLDLDMPGLGGAETARRISEHPSSREGAIAVILVSGKTRIDPTLPVDGLIEKPFDPVGLAAEVRRIAETKREASAAR